MGVLDWLTGGPPLFRSALLAPAPEQKLYYAPQNWAPIESPYAGMLVHGPGATALLDQPRSGDGNSAVFACLRALSDAYIEAPLRVYRRLGPGQEDEQPEHPLAHLLARPNPAMSLRTLRWWVQYARHIDGNAYVRKLRAGDKRRGNPVELWPISPTRIELRSDNNLFISAYRYHYAPGKWEDIPPENMLHFRLGLDDRDHRRGLSPLKRLVAHLTTDAHAQAWANSLLSNGAVPAGVLQTDQELTAEQADFVKARWQALHGNGNQGDVAVMGNGLKYTQVGFNPEQMVFRELHRLPEERITAVLRVPAIVAGLGAGLDQATYSNARQLRELFTEQTLVPLWELDEDTWQQQLLADFTNDPRFVVRHDLTDVRALQEDEDAKYQRLSRGVGGPFITVDEARADVGLAALPSNAGQVLLIPSTVTPTPQDALVPAPQEATPVNPNPSPTDIPAAFRNMSADDPERKDAANVTDADVARWRQRGRALGLDDFVDAQPVASRNGHGQH